MKSNIFNRYFNPDTLEHLFGFTTMFGNNRGDMYDIFKKPDMDNENESDTYIFTHIGFFAGVVQFAEFIPFSAKLQHQIMIFYDIFDGKSEVTLKSNDHRIPRLIVNADGIETIRFKLKNNFFDGFSKEELFTPIEYDFDED